MMWNIIYISWNINYNIDENVKNINEEKHQMRYWKMIEATINHPFYLPIVFLELKDALSSFEQSFVVLDVCKS